MQNFKTIIAVLISSSVIPFAIAYDNSNANQASVTSYTNKDIKWQDGPDALPKGVKFAILEGNPKESGPFTLRLKMPGNFHIPAHTHGGIEHVTVLSGDLYFGEGNNIDPKNAKMYGPGSFIAIQPNTTHFAFTKSETIVQLHGMGPWEIHYSDAKDDPRGQKF